MMKTWISRIWNARNEEINVTKIIVVKDAHWAVAKRKPEKNSGFLGFESWSLWYWCSALANWASEPTRRWSFHGIEISPVKMKKKWWIREIQMTSSKPSFTISGKRTIPWHIEQVFGNPCNNRQREKRKLLSIITRVDTFLGLRL